MRVELTFLGVLGICAVAAGCGAKVTVDGPQGAGGAAGTTTSTGNSGNGGSGNSGNSGNGGSATCSASCAAAITSGGLVCGTTQAEMDYVALQSCADMNCPTECMGQFDSGIGLDVACGGCLTTNCKTQQDTCNNN